MTLGKRSTVAGSRSSCPDNSAAFFFMRFFFKLRKKSGGDCSALNGSGAGSAVVTVSVFCPQISLMQCLKCVCVVGCLLINLSGCPEGKQTGRLSPVKGPKCSCPLRAATMKRLCKRRHQWLWQAWQSSLSGGGGGGAVRVHVWGSQSQAGSGLVWELRGCSGCGDTAG